jgi:hypothetical protein
MVIVLFCPRWDTDDIAGPLTRLVQGARNQSKNGQLGVLASPHWHPRIGIPALASPHWHPGAGLRVWAAETGRRWQRAVGRNGRAW